MRLSIYGSLLVRITQERGVRSLSKSNQWTTGTLLSRGWSKALMRELLPKPTFRYYGGHSIQYWDKQTVLEAEKHEKFLAAAEKNRQERAEKQQHKRTQDEAWQQKIEETSQFLQSVWAEQTLPEDAVSPLARRYHEGILSQLAAMPQGANWGHDRSQSYLSAFLALSKERAGEDIPATLRRLTTALMWAAQNGFEKKVSEFRKNYGTVLYAVAERTLSAFTAAQPEAKAEKMLAQEDFPSRELLNHPLSWIYSVYYVPKAIRTDLSMLIALNPKDEYPEARQMQRHFILHIGGTNTGKTYAGFQRLMRAGSGVYLAPLRLLALEGQETLLDAHVPCSLTTGEEEDVREGDTHVAATCEKLDMKRRWDVAVIDECQMIADTERGYAWSRAILGVLAPEIHLCAAPEAENILLHLITACGDSYEIIHHERKAPLVCMRHPVDYSSVEPGDALITFSKIGVLSMAEDLRSQGKKPAIIYGALPYATRRKQMDGFLDGEMRYVVSTDAIGMGLNLPIRRIIFTETRKFDGHEVRDLTAAEVKQIAGRAGRYGMYDRGYVGATDDLEFIRAALEENVPPIEKAVVGFSDLVLQVDFDLLQVLEEWNRLPTVEPYVKLDISRYIKVISKLREDGFTLGRELELRAANIPFDEKDPELQRLFNELLIVWAQGENPEQPRLPERNAGSYTLPELELHCKKLDLYFSFARAFGTAVDEDALSEEREQVADWINEILLHNLRNNIRFCPTCGGALPLHYRSRLCQSCYHKIHARYAPGGKRR